MNETMSSTVWTTPMPPSNNTFDAFNATASHQSLESSMWYRSLVPVILLCCVIAFFTNLAILLSVHWLRRSLSPTLCFSISLAVADAYAALVLGIGYLINSLLPVGYGIFVRNFCVLLSVEGFRMGGLIVSIFHLLLLAINHYIGIIRPLHYASTMTKRNAMVSIALMWLLPLAFVFIYFSSVPGEGFQSTDCMIFQFFKMRKFRVIVSCLFLVPLALMFVMYIHILVIVLQHNRGLQKFQGSCNFRHNIKAAVTTLVIIGTYTVGYMPAVLVYVIRCVDCAIPMTENPSVFFYVYFVTNTLMVLKVLVNPIIYAARMKDIRLAMKRMVVVCLPFAGGVAHLTDDTTSSFIRSRNDTMRTSIRMQSMYGRGQGGCDSPMLVYQKCDQIYRNGSNNHRRSVPKLNGLPKKPPLFKTPAEAVSSNDPKLPLTQS